MTDIDEVIRGFEQCLTADDCSEETCPYYSKHDGEGLCWNVLAADALDLLKEMKQKIEGLAVWYSCERGPCCRNCDEHIDKYDGYCRTCGAKVKWE